MALIKKGNSYYAVFKENGRQKWIALKTQFGEEAEIRHTQLLKERHSERFGLPKSPQDIAWSVLTERFLREKRSSGLAEETLKRNKIVLETAERVLSIRFASDWSIEKIERFKQLRSQAEIAPSTLNREIVTLKDCLRQAKRWNYSVPTIDEIDAVPRVRVPRRAPFFYPTEEIAKIIDGIEPFWRIAALLGGLEGLRRGEALHLRWRDVDFANEQVSVLNREGWSTKNRKDRVLPLFEPFVEPLRAWMAVCAGEMVLPWTRTDVDFSREFTRLLRRKGFKKGTFHTMRHSFASNLARAGVHLKLLSELLGHYVASSVMWRVGKSVGRCRALLPLGFIQKDAVDAAETLSAAVAVCREPLLERRRGGEGFCVILREKALYEGRGTGADKSGAFHPCLSTNKYRAT